MHIPPRTAASSPDPVTWSLLKELVADALEAPAAMRAEMVAARCGGDAVLQATATAMLAAATTGADFLVGPAVTVPIDPVAPLAPGTSCGPYRIEELLGEGGFSEVYRASQAEPFPRQVAVKLLKPGMDSRALLARFALERQTLARLEHPGIARILDAGATPTGRPFVVMEYVPGATLTAFASLQQPDLATRLTLFLQVCAAVVHAHQRGVIHRDLKPGNLLVTTVDGVPHAKVIDFGIAKVLAADAPGHTRDGQLLGTPSYCSPEQGRGDGGDVDVRTDVFALGVVLAELVTGVRPLPGAPVAAPWPRDSRRELGWIVAKATAADREARYADVAALAADVRALQTGGALLAGPPTRRYRAAVFVRRHRLGLAVTAVVAFAWLAGGIAAAIGFVRADEARQAAEAASREASATADYLARLIGEVVPGRAGRDVKVIDLLAASKPLLQGAEAEPDVALRLHHVVGRAYVALGEFALAEQHLRTAADGRRARHGDLDWTGIEAACDLASVLHRAGRPNDAAPLLDDVAARAERARGPQHDRARMIVDMKAKLAFDRGRPAEAEAPLRALLALDEAEGRSEAVVTTLGNLAQVLLQRGDIPAAEAAATRGRDLAVQLHGGDHPLALTAVRKLAAVAVAKHEPTEVIALLAPVHPLAVRRFGADHPETLGIANYLAYAHQQRGDREEAAALYEPLLAAQRKKLAALHPQLLMTLHNYGTLQLARREFAAAEVLLRDAAAGFRQLRGAADADACRAAVRWHLAVAGLGRDAEIAPTFVAALGDLRRAATATDGVLLDGITAAAALLQRRPPPADQLVPAWTAIFELARDGGLAALRRAAAERLATFAAAAGDAAAAETWRNASR